MDSTPKILLVGEVATLLRESKSSVYRQYKQEKIPPPLSMPGKLRWLASDIEAFLQSRAPPPVDTPTTSKQRKKQEREYEVRQRKADQALERHRKTKGKNGTQ